MSRVLVPKHLAQAVCDRAAHEYGVLAGECGTAPDASLADLEHRIREDVRLAGRHVRFLERLYFPDGRPAVYAIA